MRELSCRSLMIVGLGVTALSVLALPTWASEELAPDQELVEPRAAEALPTTAVDPAVEVGVPLEATEPQVTEPQAVEAEMTTSSPLTETTPTEGAASEADEIPATEAVSPTPAPAVVAETSPDPAAPTLEPGEEALPLEADAATTEPLSGPSSVSEPSPGTEPSPIPPSIAIPQADRPTSQGFETTPDYLMAEPNPLSLPTQPAEVEILGTQPLALETAIELAYRNSEEFQIALLQLERTRAGLRAEQALLYPTADLTATLENTNQTNFGLGLGDNATRLQGGIRADYDLGLSGERAARIRAAEEQVRLAELALERTREELRLDTTTDYYAVQEAIEQIRINQTFLTEAERNLADTQLREEVGVGTRFDVLRADVQVANARQSLTQARSQRDIAQRQLARRLNVPPSITITTLGVSIAGSWPLSLEESIVLAYQNRSELEQFLVERDLNNSLRESALAATRPNLGLFAQYDGQALLLTPEGVPTSFNDGYSFGAQFSWRLYDGGAARARATQSERDLQIDEFEFENARNTVRVQVEEAYYTLLANQANIDTANVAVNQAKEALRLAQLRFEAGVGTQLEVLSATRELTEAEGNLVRAVLDYNRALARLERSVSNLATSLD